jgi:hypothetical protein
MEKLSPDDLTAIRKLTHSEFAESEVFTFRARLIDDTPTANGRIWSREWQTANVNNFVGVPVVVNHENDQSLVLGRVYEATQKDNAIFGSVFVPLSTDIGREAKAKIDAGLFKSVSINASASNTKAEGDLTRILPGDNDRVFEVSFVAVPGCKSCEIVNEAALTNTGESCNADDKRRNHWAEYAEQMHAEATQEFIRVAGFAVGEGFCKTMYEQVASRLDPATIKTMSDDYRRICADRRERAECGNSAADQIREMIHSIKKAKGI